MRTRIDTVRLAAPLAILAGVGLTALAGCSATGTANASAPAAQATATAAANAPAPRTDTGTAGDTKPAPAAPAARPGTSPCATHDIKATVIGQPDRTRGRTRMAMILVQNVSKSTCRLEGWLSVGLVNAAGEEVPVRATNVKQPGAPMPIQLRPGGTAAAGMKWTVCDKADDTCPVGNGLRVGPPRGKTKADAALEEFPSPEKSGITLTSLQVGSLQPSRQGVVAW